VFLCQPDKAKGYCMGLKAALYALGQLLTSSAKRDLVSKQKQTLALNVLGQLLTSRAPIKLTSRAHMRRRQEETMARRFFAGDLLLLYGSQIEILEETEII